MALISESTDAPASSTPTIPHLEPITGTGTLEAANEPKQSGARRALNVLGPGFITGASDDDPSGIGAYAVTGASFGFTTLWLALFTFPLMASIQFTCAKIGMGLSGVLRRHYPRWLLYGAVGALIIANTINAGADIGAIAAGINLLVPIPIAAMIVPIALLILGLQIWGSYRTHLVINSSTPVGRIDGRTELVDRLTEM